MTTKQRIAVAPRNGPQVTVQQPGAAFADPAPNPPVVVVATKAGTVTTLDKIKGYYKGLIAAVGSILVIINEVTPLLNFLPGQDKQYVNLVIGFITTAAVFLKDNEHWVDAL